MLHLIGILYVSSIAGWQSMTRQLTSNAARTLLNYYRFLATDDSASLKLLLNGKGIDLAPIHVRHLGFIHACIATIYVKAIRFDDRVYNKKPYTYVIAAFCTTWGPSWWLWEIPSMGSGPTQHPRRSPE